LLGVFIPSCPFRRASFIEVSTRFPGFPPLGELLTSGK
jgi:hypothetical protein